MVKPIPKQVPTDEVNNYSPITLVPAISKISEKVISNWLMIFLDKHYILNNLHYYSENLNQQKMQ